MPTGLVWESVTWRCGHDHYSFEIERGGLFATLSAPGGRTLTLPMVVWDGLLDALTGNRKTKARADNQFPARSRARWYDGEAAELADKFRAGQTIVQLARAHNRTEYAIEAQLDKMGLISTAELYGPGPQPSTRGVAVTSTATTPSTGAGACGPNSGPSEMARPAAGYRS